MINATNDFRKICQNCTSVEASANWHIFQKIMGTGNLQLHDIPV